MPNLSVMSRGRALRFAGILLDRQHVLGKLIAKFRRTSPHCCRGFVFLLTYWTSVRSQDGKDGRRMVTGSKCRRYFDTRLSRAQILTLSHVRIWSRHRIWRPVERFSSHFIVCKSFAFMNANRYHFLGQQWQANCFAAMVYSSHSSANL